MVGCIFIRNLEVYGEEIFTTIGYFDPYYVFITIDDVYRLNEEYLKNSELIVEDADKLLNKYTLNYVDIEYIWQRILLRYSWRRRIY